MERIALTSEESVVTPDSNSAEISTQSSADDGAVKLVKVLSIGEQSEPVRAALKTVWEYYKEKYPDKTDDEIMFEAVRLKKRLGGTELDRFWNKMSSYVKTMRNADEMEHRSTMARMTANELLSE